MSSQLFDPGPEPEKLSYDRRLTIRRKRMLDQGVHPVTMRPLAGNGETCGTCAHHMLRGNVAGRFHKCDRNNTGGPVTDLRVGWPACTGWEPKT